MIFLPSTRWTTLLNKDNHTIDYFNDFAWIPTRVRYCNKSDREVIVWFKKYKTVVAKIDQPKEVQLQYERFLNIYEPNQGSVLTLAKTIEAFEYYNNNKRKISRLLKNNKFNQIHMPKESSSPKEWGAEQWKYLAILSVDFLDKMLSSESIILTDIYEEAKLY